MDGHFVPVLTVGPLVVQAIKPLTLAAGAVLDVHLMIEAPERLIPAFARSGADSLTVHVETCPHLHRTIHQIKDLGLRASVTLNPATPLNTLEEILGDVDMVLIMSVNPGFGGQEYIAFSTDRIARLHAMLEERGRTQVEIEVDGGVTTATIDMIVGAGATVLVAGSAIFNANASVAENIAALRRAVKVS
jgi:ribulose-phosphate 3-epimerase